MTIISNAHSQEGKEVLTFDPNSITELSVTAEGLRLIAHRWSVERQVFHIAVFTKTGVETCVAGDGFARVLAGLHTIRTQRVLSAAETRRVQDSEHNAIRLRLVAYRDIEPAEWTFYVPKEGGTHLIGQSEDMELAAELSIGTEPFVLLGEGCRGLQAPPERH